MTSIVSILPSMIKVLAAENAAWIPVPVPIVIAAIIGEERPRRVIVPIKIVL